MSSRSVRALGAALVFASLVAWPSLGRAQDAAGSTTTVTQTVGPTTMPPMRNVDVPVEQPNAGPNAPMLASGTVLFGGTYLSSIIVASQSGRPDDQNLYYPLVGPWMDLAQRNCTAFPCGNENADKALLILDGIGQGVGAALMVTSLFVPNGHHYLTVGSRDKSGPRVTFTPSQVGTSGYGVGAVGLF